MAAKKKMPKDRNMVVLLMILTRKGGKHKDRKLESKRKAGRVVLDD